MVNNRPSTLDIALTKEIALNLNCIETLHILLFDHRPIPLKMGPPDGGSPNSTLKITDWKKVSTALVKIDTPSLNSIPNDISITDEIDCHSSAPRERIPYCRTQIQSASTLTPSEGSP
ncbi:hypothetical protein EVAR_79874_1 [Eumeta japonica]|uniref:Uncharacterized protein n=1 Tax=Eumeta variegata TaxID=151549 RepID=A0A4C1TZN8_EUMVA|nr:hypothetical protein EVAR_79874_1 [Eumeta japonica]